MAFMMPVMKNDWDIYNSQKSRKTSESAEKCGAVGRVRKVSESRSEGPARGGSARALALSPHRSAPAMRSLSYRAPPARESRASLHARQLSQLDRQQERQHDAQAPASPARDKLHTRLVEKVKRALCRADPRREERAS